MLVTKCEVCKENKTIERSKPRYGYKSLCPSCEAFLSRELIDEQVDITIENFVEEFSIVIDQHDSGKLTPIETLGRLQAESKKILGIENGLQ